MAKLSRKETELTRTNVNYYDRWTFQYIIVEPYLFIYHINTSQSAQLINSGQCTDLKTKSQSNKSQQKKKYCRTDETRQDHLSLWEDAIPEGKVPSPASLDNQMTELYGIFQDRQKHWENSSN